MIKKILFVCIGLISLFFISIFINMFIDWKYNSMEGLFEFKLGMSEEALREVVDTALLKDTTGIFEESDHDKILEGKIKTLRLEHYAVDSIYKIEDIRLSFFENKLYNIEIKSYNRRTEFLLSQKYRQFKDEKEYFDDGELHSEEKRWNTHNFSIGCSSYRSFFSGIETTYSLNIIDRTTSEQVYNQLKEYYVPKGKENNTKSGLQELMDRL